MDCKHCEKCGVELEARREGSVQGLFCKQCGWQVITSYIPAIHLDQTDYEVHACGGDFRNASHIKAVSEVSGLNFLGARQLLEHHDPVVFKGKAPEVCRARAVLVEAGLGYLILPPFPHTESDFGGG